MTIKLAARVQAVKPSATLAVDARAKALKAAGKDVVGLGRRGTGLRHPGPHQGRGHRGHQPGLHQVHRRGRDAQPQGRGRPPSSSARTAWTTPPEQILVSCGGKQSFFNLALAVIDPGDEVVIPAPYWVSYPDIVLLAGGAPVLVHAGAEQRFKITPAQLRAALN